MYRGSVADRHRLSPVPAPLSSRPAQERDHTRDPLSLKNEQMLLDLLESRLVLEEDWQRLESSAHDVILGAVGTRACLNAMIHHGLVNNFQAGRIEAGTTFGMILGNYRVLDRIVAG